MRRFSWGGDRTGWWSGALSGLLCALALPPFHFWPLAFFGLIPLVLACSGPEADRGSTTRAGLGFGIVFHGVLLHWVPPTLHGMIPFGALSGLLLIVLLAGVGGILGHLLYLLTGPPGRWPPALALPVLWVGAETVLAHAGYFAFPWLPLSLALTRVPEIAGIAELAGGGVLTGWLASVNGLLAMALGVGPDRPAPRRRLSLGAAAVVLVALAAGWGVWRAASLAVAPLPPIRVLQMELPREVLLDSARRDEWAAESLDRLLGPEPDSLYRFVLLPEAPFSALWEGELEDRVLGYAERLGVPILFGTHLSGRGWKGAVTPDGTEDGSTEVRNAILLVAPGGNVEVLHGKVRRVPGVEWPGLVAGPRGDAFEVAGVRIGILICFEGAFPSDARRLVRNGAVLLVNPSNDGWFRPRGGDGTGAAHAQERAHLVLRAIEGRVGVIRSPVGGELLLIDPTGRVAFRSAPGGEASAVLSPTTSPLVPLGTRWGGAFGWLGLAGLIAMRLTPFRRGAPRPPIGLRGRSRAGQEPTPPKRGGHPWRSFWRE